MKLAGLFFKRAAAAGARRGLARAVACMPAVLCALSVAAQTTIHVAGTGSDASGDGSALNPYLTISNGVAHAVNGDTVLVSSGIYPVTANVYITNAIIVRGLDAPAGAVITTMYPDPAHSTRCVRVNHPGAVVEGVTVEKGYPPVGDTSGRGGGIYVQAGVVTNCIVRHCRAIHGGGGIYATGTASVVTDCLVISNEMSSTATWGGGGVAVWSGAQLLRSLVATNFSLNSCGGGVEIRVGGIVYQCQVVDNCITGANLYGGGIRVVYNGVVDSCLISNNYSSTHAGGIYYQTCTSILANCTVVGNRANNGGGGVMTLNNSIILVSNCLIACNQANYGAGLANNALTSIMGIINVAHSRVIANTNTGSAGAGMFFQDNRGLVENCVIASNVVGIHQKGAGLYIHNAYTADAAMEVRNCLITGNRSSGSASEGGGVYVGTGIVTLAGCTLTDNAANHGGGMAVNGGIPPGNLAVWNTVVVSNQTVLTGAPDLRLPADHLTNAFYYSCGPVLTNAAQGNITNPPVFAGYADGNYRLEPDSPGINTGTNQAWMDGAVDLAGRARIDRFSLRADMGCYEYVPRGAIFGFR